MSVLPNENFLELNNSDSVNSTIRRFQFRTRGIVCQILSQNELSAEGLVLHVWPMYSSNCPPRLSDLRLISRAFLYIRS
jgi:hypothetical protein